MKFLCVYAPGPFSLHIVVRCTMIRVKVDQMLIWLLLSLSLLNEAIICPIIICAVHFTCKAHILSPYIQTFALLNSQVEICCSLKFKRVEGATQKLRFLLSPELFSLSLCYHIVGAETLYLGLRCSYLHNVAWLGRNNIQQLGVVSVPAAHSYH